MAKLLKLRRGTTTQHASFTGAEGELTVDITKDTAVVHDGAQAGGRPLAREDMSNVSSSTVVSRIGTSALAGVKVQPNFGTQLVETDGNLDVAGTAATGALTVTGNISVSGTVDGIDVAGLQAAKNSLSTSNGALVNGVIATTQAQSDNTTKVATTAYVKTAVANVVDSAPAALDTLNELAAALGDDANYATTTANTIGTKLPKSGGQMTGNITMAGSQTVDGRDLSVDGSKLDGIESGATADQTKSDIDALNINADQVDGLHASQFLRSDTGDQANGDITFSGGSGAVTVSGGSDIRITGGAWTGEYTGGIKIQPDGGASYFQYHGNLYFRNTSGNNRLTLDQSGNLTANGNVTAYSDARLKTDIHTINDALSICGKLRGVSYKWIADGKAGIGVIAQEVEEVIPEVVLTNQDVNPVTQEITEVKSVDYGKIVGVLINAINELKEEVEELKNAKIT